MISSEANRRIKLSIVGFEWRFLCRMLLLKYFGWYRARSLRKDGLSYSAIGGIICCSAGEARRLCGQ